MKIEFENDKSLEFEFNPGGRYPISIEFGDLDEKHEQSLSHEEIKELITLLLEAL